MGKTMKFFTKTAIAAFAATAMLTAAPAGAQITSITDLLAKVRQDAESTKAENLRREAEFRAKANEQTQILAAARKELAALESRARQVQNTFDSNQVRIDRLSEELKIAQGDFGEVFGLARSKAGEFKATLDNSLITAEYPSRTAVLGRVAESKALPSTDDLNAIWQSMLNEIQAQRQVSTFEAAVANEGDGAKQAVTRVGPFAVFTADGSRFLEYKPAAEAGDITLVALPKPPSKPIVSAAKAVAKAKPGELVYAPIDPTRGALLKSFERFPTLMERLNQGGPIGWMVVVLAVIGSVFGILNIIRLFLTSSAVRAQKRKAQASKSNPLGRIMMAYESVKDRDSDTIELKLDEAILQESPKLEFGLNLLKLGAGIAPLMGLLGTVTGMIKTFQAMMIYGTGDPQLMAGGISEALVTTMLGLIAAIPLLILHSFCSSLARGVQGTLEEQSAGIVARHVEARG